MTSTLRAAALAGLGCAALMLIAPATASAAPAPTPTIPGRILATVPGPPSARPTLRQAPPLPTAPPTAVPGGGALQVPAGRVEIQHGSAVWPAGLLAAGGVVLLAGAVVVVRRR